MTPNGFFYDTLELPSEKEGPGDTEVGSHSSSAPTSRSKESRDYSK